MEAVIVTFGILTCDLRAMTCGFVLFLCKLEAIADGEQWGKRV